MSFLISKHTKPRVLLANFFIKMTMKVKWLILAYVVTQALAAIIFMYVEGWSFIDGIWWSQVASLTIGYGDIAPKTILGRLIAGPFHYLWVYYIGLSLGAHVVAFLFRNKNELTHHEQEWLFKVVRVTYDRVRWCTIALAALVDKQGIRGIPQPPHILADGTHAICPEEAADTEFGNLDDEESLLANPQKQMQA